MAVYNQDMGDRKEGFEVTFRLFVDMQVPVCNNLGSCVRWMTRRAQVALQSPKKLGSQKILRKVETATGRAENVTQFLSRTTEKADLELVGLSLSLTTLAGLSDRLSKIPLGKERPQTAICCLEWLGRWKCLATGLDASLSFLSTSWRCSRNRSPSRLPVSPKNFIDGNSALHVSFYNLSTLLQSNCKVT